MADVRLLGCYPVNAIGIASLVSLALPVVVVVVIVRALTGRRGGAPVSPGQMVRRFFQYVLLYGVLVVAASGLSTLGGLIGASEALVDTSGSLARGLTFILIGGPLLVVLWRWTRATQAADEGETRALGWLVYVAATALTAVGVAMASVYGVVVAAGRGELDVPALTQTVVWGAVWLVHLRLESELSLPEHRQLHHLLGSLLGWILTLIGLIALLRASLDTILLGDVGALVTEPSDLVPAVGLLVAGVPVWSVYWWLGQRTAPATPLWFGYVLLVGVGASLVTTVSGASVALYRGLVWAIGDLGGESTTDWTSGTLSAVAVAVVGGISWWYHRAVVDARASTGRTEVVRVHEYILAGIALVAAAVGVVLVVVAFIEAVTPTADVLVDASLTNAVLAALTLVLVGGPLWWVFWRRIRSAVAADRSVESASPTRRIYLYLLFGLTGVVAIIAVLIAVYGLLNAALADGLGGETVRNQRGALGVLVAAAALAAYHWAVYREDRRLAPAAPEPTLRFATAEVPAEGTIDATGAGGPIAAVDRVLLIGPPDDDLVAAVRDATGAQVELWVQDAGVWDRSAVLAAIGRSHRRRVLLHADGEQIVEAGPPR